MAFDPGKFTKYRTRMHRRIEVLRGRTEDSLEFAVDHLMQDRVDTYFKMEEGFTEIVRALQVIEEELSGVDFFAGAQRLESRLEFLEDRFEELDSEARERPRRRRRKIDFAAFFRAAGGGDGELTGPRGEIATTSEALGALGLEHGSSMSTITKAFRERAKRLHPDVRKGDRTSEPELRRIIEAYQYLKESVTFSQTEPPRDS